MFKYAAAITLPAPEQSVQWLFLSQEAPPIQTRRNASSFTLAGLTVSRLTLQGEWIKTDQKNVLYSCCRWWQGEEEEVTWAHSWVCIRLSLLFLHLAACCETIPHKFRRASSNSLWVSHWVIKSLVLPQLGDLWPRANVLEYVWFSKRHRDTAYFISSS